MQISKIVKIVLTGLILTILVGVDSTYALVAEEDSQIYDNDTLGGNKNIDIPEQDVKVDVPPPQVDIFKNSTVIPTPPVISATGNAFGTATMLNTYQFISETEIQNTAKSKKLKWSQVLAAKEIEVANEVIEASKTNYKVNTISGDLDLSTGDTLWGSKNIHGDLEEQGYTVLIRITVDSDDAYLLIDNLSATNVANTIQGIDQYKDAVRQGVTAGGMVSGFNLYNMYSQYNVLLSEILDKTDGTGSIINNANLKYSSEIFFHPILGKLKIKDLTKNKTIKYNSLDTQTSLIQLTHTSRDKVSYTVDAGFRVFNDPSTQERGFFTKVSTSNASIQEGVTEYTSKYNPMVKKTLSGIADTTMYLAIPTAYSLETANDSYILKDSGYKVVDGLKLVAHKNEVYEINNGTLELKGKFSDYGIDPKELVMYKTVDDGGTVGALIPLRYKEVIYNPKDGKSHYTGRSVILNGDFKKNIRLDKANENVFGVEGNMVEGEKLVNYAFPEGGNYKSQESHKEVKNTEGVFTIQTDYIKPSGGTSLFGAVIARNNVFAKDTKLLEWLDTPKAQSMEGVDAELLKKLILGEMKVDKTELTYDEWLRLQEIKNEMNSTWEEKSKKLLYQVLFLGGFILVIYSITFSLIWFVDTMASFTDVSLMHIMTFGRCYPLASLEHIEQVGLGGDVKYVTLKTALITTTLGCFIGATFMTVEPILQFLVWFYLGVTGITESIR